MAPLTIFFVVALLVIVHSMEVTLDDGPYGSCGTKSDDLFTFLDDAERPFCLKFSNANSDSDTPYYYYYFGTRVDMFTLVTLKFSNLGESTADVNNTDDLTWTPNTDIGVQFEAGNKTTQTLFARRLPKDSTGNYTGDVFIFTQVSVVVLLDQGKVDEVIFDTGCYSCPEDRCIDGNCAIRQDECQAGTGKCDFSIYVSWYGTDAKGRYLLSAGERLSQFQSTSANTYYNYVRKNLDTDFLEFCCAEE